MIHNKAVQGNHWVNDQISIFTAVSYQGDSTQSYAVISDNRQHDSAYALLAVEKTAANSLARSFLKFNLLIPLIKFQ